MIHIGNGVMDGEEADFLWRKEEPEKSRKLPLLTPPEAFGVVENGIYRSNVFDKTNFSFIENLGLKVIVHLSLEALTKTIRNFLKQQNIKLVHLGLAKWNEHQQWKSVNVEMIKEGLELILNVERHPIMIMSSFGLQETGVLVGCLRRMQQWSLSSALGEYRRYAQSKARRSSEEFLELFDIDLVTLPKSLPLWFRNSLLMMQQEEYAEKEMTQQRDGMGVKAFNYGELNYFDLTDFGCKLISEHVNFDPKLSILEGDDD